MASKFDFTNGKGYAAAYDDLKIWERTFLLHPKRWKTAKSKFTLNWDWVKFSKANAVDVPTERGLYAFIVEHCPSYFPPHGYIMYVGITGDTSGKRNLRVRFNDYLKEAEEGGRAKVVVMLNKYKGSVYFHYATVPQLNQSLTKIEDEMLAAIVPPCNEVFVAEIRPAVKALR